MIDAERRNMIDIRPRIYSHSTPAKSRKEIKITRYRIRIKKRNGRFLLNLFVRILRVATLRLRRDVYNSEFDYDDS